MGVYANPFVPSGRLVGDTVTEPEPPLVPVPERETESVVVPAVIFQVALSALVVLGVKVTEAVQVADAARLEPQVVVAGKSL